MALIVEDGTGIEDADSYLSVADADTIIANYGYSTSWAGLTTTEKEQYLRQGSLEFDGLLSWASQLLTVEQGLLFPREVFTDANGREVSGITGLIKRSVAQLTAAVSEGVEDKDPVYLSSQSWGDSSETYSKPLKIEDTVYNEVALRLKRAGYGRSSSSVVDIYRA